ncbi:MAG: VCBS repeat-containing protein [Lachnospiraceae bacterium]|nr:VCBS repeat-containing protein [Lachnospiraceae bacterium]
MEENYHRLAIFLADAEGKILFKTNELETNNRIPGQLWQPTRDLGAVTFTDLNQDGRTDIVLITRCVNDTGEYAGKPYKIGDVLFQGEGIFYRDWRISDKINRFDMNRSVNSIISFVRDGNSTEFLYTATTLDELLKNGFTIIEEQHYTRRFEKLGRIQVVPGTFRMSEYDIFMIYLVDEQGDIVWSFQPMGSYDNLYSLRGVVGKDVDGDGMKDLIVLARYTYEGPSGELLIQSACSIYYQRTSGFDIDTGFTENYLCTEEDTMEALIPKIRAYWGWKVEEAEDD